MHELGDLFGVMTGAPVWPRRSSRLGPRVTDGHRCSPYVWRRLIGPEGVVIQNQQAQCRLGSSVALWPAG